MAANDLRLNIEHTEYPNIEEATLHITVSGPIKYVSEVKRQMRDGLTFAAECTYVRTPGDLKATDEDSVPRETEGAS